MRVRTVSRQLSINRLKARIFCADKFEVVATELQHLFTEVKRTLLKVKATDSWPVENREV